jgi:hypothetical protein
VEMKIGPEGPIFYSNGSMSDNIIFLYSD